MKLFPPPYDPLKMSPMEKQLANNGGVRWMLISIIIALFPVLMLSKGWAASLILLFVIWFIPFFGDIFQFGVVLWAIIKLFTTSFSIISVLFILSLIVYLLFVIFPFLLNLFVSIKSR